MKTRRTVFLTLVAAIILAAAVFILQKQKIIVPSFQTVHDSYKKSEAVLLDRHGEVVHELRIDEKGRRLDWISLNNISPSLLKAVIHSEDRRFYKHSGIDWKAVVSAALQSPFATTSRGASTITMQLASMLDKRLKPIRQKRTFKQKWIQMRLAREMEQTWTKDNILEAYLNLIALKGELQGIAAASRGLFNKEPGGLNETEASLLASLIRSPNADNNDVARRACVLADFAQFQISCEDIKKLSEKTLLGGYYIRPAIALAPHVASQLLKRGDEKAASTLDGNLQRYALEVLQHQINILKKQNVHDGAILVVENKTGDVLAYVANGDDYSSAVYVDGIKAKRQAGSILKPFLYGLAFEKRILTPASIIDDSPIDISVTGGVYRPKNYDSQFHGLVTARTALASSLNVPSVKTLQLVGIESFLQKLRDLGLEDLNEEEDFYGPSLALGSADVSLWGIVNAYRMLANDGIWSKLRLVPDKDTETSWKKIFSKEASFIVSDVLSDRVARSPTFGLENPLSTRFWTAVKTGTSKDMRDNWCIGYSSQYTVGVWIGNFSGESMWNVSGITGAAPIWIEVMNRLHSRNPGEPKTPPFGIVAKKVELMELRQKRIEWFIKGTEPDVTVVKIQDKQKTDRIIYPVAGTVIALDPDIPDTEQRIFFEAEPRDAGFIWMLDGKVIGNSEEGLSWAPSTGKHALSLVNQEGRAIDSINFEVRGAVAD
ncbi:MAG: penicillin-binding protein 1C [Deltaproteobacteria bacterium GWC2_42_51]|nr:MAG: penicillin-binding protein 1C [Deltaproteobacteria bacterium GWA2_42_85]OGP37180.1 MAG: penicillin-binding protein 1C [Deltaproteobacteria bacterium GWC2_42_51]OGP46686.1 MAG: penicillin-binding protein 1C [Deltaproteobacteria bacterium GWF2_42_12]OGQ23785.1 MAG: penicillin-binding protein 1C [Deltaproteobacteria bacterium RIFCSPHIGHO2_02_FULL_42_44]OGQ36533.1 MAG: penicillin-binding protein 1C [Deltaproteobacteria bacterium RIFCSPLOWO2_02_FULL_42_39]OGQ66255.1 MAG: penicillin-binding 